PIVHRPNRPPLRPMRPNMNVARLNRTSFNKLAHSYTKRPFQRTSTVRSQSRAPWVPTVSRNFSTFNRKFPTANRKFPTSSTKFSTADMGKKGNAGSFQNNIDDKGYWDSGCFRHMTGNTSYLSDYEPFNGGYVSFGQGGCKITGKGTIKTGKLEFENVYFVKDLKYNLFSVSQICNNKNSVLFTNSECIVLGRDFKLLDDANVLLRTSRTHAIGFLKPFGCHVMILNTLDNLGKFEAKGDEGYFIGYSMTSKAFRVFNKRTKRVEENLHVEFLENKAIEKGSGPNWLFDIDFLTKSMNYVPVDAGTISTKLSEPSSDAKLISKRVANQEETPSLDNILSLTNRFEYILGVTSNSDESNGGEADLSNMETAITASPTPTLRIHKDHPKSQIIGPVDTLIQTRNKSKEVGEQSFIATIHQKTDPALFQFRLFSCFLSQVEPKKIFDALQDPILEEGIDYDEVFAPVARIEATILFLAYALFMGFTVYQMDVKSTFLYGTIDEEVYVMQPPGFQDSEFPAKVNKVEKAMYGLHQAPRAWYGTLSKYLLKNGFRRGKIDQTLFIRRQREDFIIVQKEDGIFLSQDKYVGDILKKFGYTDVRSLNTPMDNENPWGKDGTGKDVDLHLYRSMIGSLMYLTASRPDIMFAVCACATHQVTPKECHLHAVKRIFRYLKGHPKLELWYPKESPVDLVAYSDSDYGGATQDRKSTTEGCQFLGRRLISWQCKKQTIIATSATEAKYVAAASCCGQVLDCFEKKLINVDHIHTDENVADLLTKPFDAGRFQFSILCEALSKEISSSILCFGNLNPTATPTNPPADLVETLTVETPIPTVSSPVPTAYFIDSQKLSSETRLISKRVSNQVETPSLDNILTLTNRFEDILGATTNSDESNKVEADVSNMETTITASPTPTLRIHKDHPKSQIIGPMDTPIQTRNKSKEVENRVL
nr:hypothetical protein [Tanacetum cinerariifolium]